jgi:hypothetical protein
MQQKTPAELLGFFVSRNKSSGLRQERSAYGCGFVKQDGQVFAEALWTL